MLFIAHHDKNLDILQYMETFTSVHSSDKAKVNVYKIDSKKNNILALSSCADSS